MHNNINVPNWRSGEMLLHMKSLWWNIYRPSEAGDYLWSHPILLAQNSLLLISKPWRLSAPRWCSRMLKVHFSTSMQEHQFPTSPPPTTILPRWIGFKYNLGYCQMRFTSHFLMAHPLISVLFSLFSPHQKTLFFLLEEKCFFFFGASWQLQGC